MLTGVTTEIYAARQTSLVEDIAELRTLAMDALEIVPKCLEDFQETSTVYNLVTGLTHLSVRMPDLGLKTSWGKGEINQTMQAGISFAASIGATLFTVPLNFSKVTDVEVLANTLLSLREAAEDSGMQFAVLNPPIPSSDFGKLDVLCQLVAELQCSITFDLANAFFGMPEQMVQFIRERHDCIAAVLASDATEAFSHLPLGTGHVNFPLLLPLFEQVQYAGPFLIRILHDVARDRITDSQFYLESLEM